MSARSSRFSGFGSRRRRGRAAGAAIVCSVMLLAGCGGSGGSSADAGAPVIRGDAPVAVALSVSNSPPSGTVDKSITLTTAGGSSTGAVTFAVMGNGCTITDASLTASTTGTCNVTATQGTETSAVVAFTIGAKVMTVTVSGRKAAATGGRQPSADAPVFAGDGYSVSASDHGSGISLVATDEGCWFDNNSSGWSAILHRSTAGTCYVTAYQQGSQVSDPTPFIFAVYVSPCQQLGETVSVTFSGNGGSGSMATQSEVGPGVVFRLSANRFILSGYTFGGWATTSTGSREYADKEWYNPCHQDKLFATWVAVPSKVTFNANGGSGSLASQSASTATALTLNADAIKRSGYGFDGWATTQTGSMAYADGASYPFTASETLYARWLPTKTVTFSANLGTGTMANQASHVATALTANGFERKAYVFDGWATTETGKQAYPNGGSYPFTSDSTLYARWVCKPFAVTVTGAYGLGTTTASVNFETTSELPMATVTAKTTTGGYSATKTTSALSGVIDVKNLVKNTAYKFKVTATNTAGCSSTNPGEVPFRK